MSREEAVVNLLRSYFNILKVYHGNWDKESLRANLWIIYSFYKRWSGYREYSRLIKKKCDLYGHGDFEIIIAKDEKPNIENVKIPNKHLTINTHILDIEQALAQLFQNNESVLCTSNAWESNRLLTLLFGLNVEDFLSIYDTEKNEFENYQRNCVGVGGYKDLEEFCYVLNNCIKYCVIDQGMCLCKGNNTKEKNIEILFDQKRYAVYLLSAKKKDTSLYTVKIGEEDVLIKLRFVGDGFCDRRWESKMLENGEQNGAKIYYAKEEDRFYYCLYEFLIRNENECGILCVKDFLQKYNKEMSSADLLMLLDDYLSENGYEYYDLSNENFGCNRQNIAKSGHALRHGRCIRVNMVNDDSVGPFYSYVFKTENSYVKTGTPWLIENEIKYLQKLSAYEEFPSVIKHGKERNGCFLEITEMKGVPFHLFFNKLGHIRPKYIKDFIRHVLRLLIVLSNNDIMHRDVRSDNILVYLTNRELKVSLIDFGWASDFGLWDTKRPNVLCDKFVPYNEETNTYDKQIDTLEFANGLLWIWGKYPSVRQIAEELKIIAEECNKDALETSRRLQTLYDSFQDFTREDRKECLRQRFLLVKKKSFGKIKIVLKMILGIKR